MKIKARSTLIATATAVLSLLLVGTASATHLSETGSPGGPTVPWGFNEGWGWSNPQLGWWSADLTTTQVRIGGAIQPDALSADRFSVQWAMVEQIKGKYDWTEPDGEYEAMQRYAPQPVMVLANAPVWARDRSAQCPVSGLCLYPPLAKYDSQWKKFVRAAIARYPNVRAIEVWNEPNLGRFWAPAPDPKRYGAILRAAHDAAVAQRSTKPVVVGGLGPAANTATTMGAAEYLKQVYASAGAGYFEGIGAHPYTTQVPLVENMAKRLDKLRAVRDASADSGTSLWITEMGLSSDGTSGVTLENQGDELARLYRSIEGHDVAVFIIHRFHDIGYEAGYWNQTGVVYEDLTAKPAYCQLATAIGTPCGG